MNDTKKQFQDVWRKTYESAKTAAANHQAAVTAYQDRQSKKGYYIDYDLCAQTQQANNALYSAYNHLQSICLELYSKLQEQQHNATAEAQQRVISIASGSTDIKTAFWQLFFKSNALAVFLSPNCPNTDRLAIVAEMQKDIEKIPALGRVIDLLTSYTPEP